MAAGSYRSYMPPIVDSRPAGKLPGTAAWFLGATLLLILLCVGNLSRLAGAPAQASRPTPPTAAKIYPSAWRQSP